MLLSIITPSYNQGQFIERTILSVKKQNYKKIEHIVFDNESSDNTKVILNKYKDSIKFFIEKDNGQAHAVNKGLKIASGEIIGWLNSDDIYFDNVFKKIIQFFKENPSVDVIYGNAHHIDNNDNKINAYDTEMWDKKRLESVCFICQPTVFFRKKIFSKVGFLDESLNYCMDYDFWIRFAKHGLNIKRLNFLIAGSRLYDSNKTLGSRLKVHLEINSMLRKNYGKTPDKWLFNYAHVKTDELGVQRNNKYLYLILITYFTMYASLRWNKKISKSFFCLALKLYGIIK